MLFQTVRYESILIQRLVHLVQFAYTPKEVFTLAYTYISACWVGPQRAQKSKNHNRVTKDSEQGFLVEFIFNLEFRLLYALYTQTQPEFQKKYSPPGEIICCESMEIRNIKFIAQNLKY